LARWEKRDSITVMVDLCFRSDNAEHGARTTAVIAPCLSPYSSKVRQRTVLSDCELHLQAIIIGHFEV